MKEYPYADPTNWLDPYPTANSRYVEIDPQETLAETQADADDFYDLVSRDSRMDKAEAWLARQHPVKLQILRNLARRLGVPNAEAAEYRLHDWYKENLTEWEDGPRYRRP